MGSRHKTRRRQVISIPPLPVTIESATPATTADAQTSTTLSVQVEIAPEPLRAVSIAEVSMQPPMVNSQLGWSYITNMQVHNDGSNVSICSLDLEAHINLRSHFNEWLNDKVYITFKELISRSNKDSIKEVLLKI